MASCLECSDWIDPRRWLCEKCEAKAIAVWTNLSKEEQEKHMKKK